LISDASLSMAKAFDVLGPNFGPDGKLTMSPTTMLIDQAGIVRWIFRADRFIERIAPDDLLAAAKAHGK
jgi:peroxiredoxin